MKVHVLDANALYRYLTGSPGAETVNRLFKEARDAEQPLRAGSPTAQNEELS
jgi:hypothetical protein